MHHVREHLQEEERLLHDEGAAGEGGGRGGGGKQGRGTQVGFEFNCTLEKSKLYIFREASPKQFNNIGWEIIIPKTKKENVL